MSLLKFIKLKKNKSSANVAKERLQIIISHERTQRTNPEYLNKMQEEILDVIAKYVKIDRRKAKVHVEKGDGHSVLELNVAMPEEILEAITEE